tara:strand:- start:328 stop:1563 length:1236 start_codon:yes stop_codon:yes gene_type:complete
MANTLNLGGGDWATNASQILAYNNENGNYKPLPYTNNRNTSASTITKDRILKRVSINEPRISYLDNPNGALLTEAETKNYIPMSSRGSYGNGPGSELVAQAPDMSQTAIRPVPNDGSDRYQYDIPANTFSSGTIFIFSWYRKRFSTPVDTSYLGDLYQNALVNMATGTTTQIESNINGYDRFQITTSITNGAVASIYRMYFGFIIGSGNSSVAYWGQQLEVVPDVACSATSLIYTNNGVVGINVGTAITSGTSRGNDSIDRTSTSPNIQGDFSIYFSFGKTKKNNTGSVQYYQIATTSGILYFYTNGSANASGLNIYSPSLGGYIFGTNANNAWGGAESKVCLTYNATSDKISYFINGALYNSTTQAFSVGTTTTSSFVNSTNAQNIANMRDYRFYNETLSDAKAKAITTL